MPSRVRDSAPTVLLCVVATGVAGGLVVWAIGLREAADAVWAAVIAVVLLTEVGGELRQLRRGGIGVDLVAILTRRARRMATG